MGVPEGPWGLLDRRLAGNSHAQVVDALGGAIVRGEHAEGATLPRDEELEARFGVSRTVLREAVKTLTAKGLLVARARVGTKVRPRAHWTMFDADVLRWHMEGGAGRAFLVDLSEMRLGVEPLAARLAAERAGEEAVEAMRAIVGRMAGASDGQAFALADIDLHRAVIQASGNAFMHSVGALIEAALLASFRLSSPADDPAVQAEVARDHARIVEAVAARDGPGAEAAMARVIVVGRDRIVRAL